MELGEPFNLTRLVLSAHAGTHVDAPNHFLAGARGIEEVPLAALAGACLVWEPPGVGPIGADLLAELPTGIERLLLKTGLHTWWLGDNPALPDEFRALRADGAALLVERGIQLVGTDAPSIDLVGDADYPAHHTLLSAGVVVVESLNLSGVVPGAYALVCLPLLLPGADGAPARAILLEGE